MPAEQRVITLGFVTIGLVVAAILYLTIGGGDSVTGTLETLKGELYPRYKEAERDRDYNGWRQAAKGIQDALEAGKRKTMETNLQAEATGTDRDAQRLYKLVTDGTIDRVANAEFPYEGQFYPQAVHSALSELAGVVGGEFKTLSRARRLSQKLTEAVSMLRSGSGQPIPDPKPFDLGSDDNPLLAHDAKAFAVFRLDPDHVQAAIESKNPGGGANVFRVRWNDEKPGEKAGNELLAIREELANLSQVVARFKAGHAAIQSHPQGPAAAKKIYAQACDRLAADLPPDARDAFEAKRADYESGAPIVRMMETEEKILRQGEARWEALAKQLARPFPN